MSKKYFFGVESFLWYFTWGAIVMWVENWCYRGSRNLDWIGLAGRMVIGLRSYFGLGISARVRRTKSLVGLLGGVGSRFFFFLGAGSGTWISRGLYGYFVYSIRKSLAASNPYESNILTDLLNKSSWTSLIPPRCCFSPLPICSYYLSKVV